MILSSGFFLLFILDDTALGALDEGYDVFYFGGHLHLFLDALYGHGCIEATLIDVAVGLMDGINLLASEAATAQTYEVEAAVSDGLAGGNDIGRNLLATLTATLHHYVATDATELVDEHGRADDGKVVNDNLACQLCLVANDTAVAHDSVVRYMYTFHEQVVAAHDGAPLGCSASVDGHVLAYGVVVANLGCSLLSAKLEVLRDGADDCTREDCVAITDA